MDAGGWKQQGGRLWTGRGLLSDGRVEEFDEDMSFPIRDLATDRDHGFTYDLSDVDHISTQLGIPWERSKDIDFSSSFPFIGFIWDIEKRQSLYDQKRKANIFVQSRNGGGQGPTPWRRSKSCTENCHTPLWLIQMEGLTSPAWNPCLGYFTTVLTFHAPHPDNFPPTSIGGRQNSPNQPLEEVYQQRTRSLISMLTQTQARAQASQLSLERDGERGNFSQDGTQTRETLDGQRPWGSNSSCEPSRISTHTGDK